MKPRHSIKNLATQVIIKYRYKVIKAPLSAAEAHRKGKAMKSAAVSALSLAITVSGSVSAAPTISAIVDQTSAFLVANNLQSARITITGFEVGMTLRGFIGPPIHPWNVRTGDASAFYNSGSIPDPNSPGEFLFEDGFYAARANLAPFDSGFLGGSSNNPAPVNFGTPIDDDATDDVGQFALLSAGGNSDIDIDPMAWISLVVEGLPPPPTLNVLRLTWSAQTSATVSFMFLTVQADYPMSITLPPVPGPSGFTLMAVAALHRPRRRRGI